MMSTEATGARGPATPAQEFWKLAHREIFRPQFERTLRYPRSRSLRVRYSVGFAFGIAVLLGLGYLYGHKGSPSTGVGVLNDIAVAVKKPIVSGILALLAVTFAANCVRRLWLERLASVPGTIRVPDFALAPGVSDVSAARLTTEFRNRLATLRLESATPAPGPVQQSDFLDVLSAEKSSDPTNKVIAFVRATFPSSALAVRGTLITRPSATHDRFGVSLQVTRAPDQGSILPEIWDTTWERAVRRAADAASESILPRTRLGRGPWVAWRGFVMPQGLLNDYESASELNRDRRYYAALEACYRALDCDPLNRATRLQLGKIQEQLGLYLDALGTYQGIVTASRPGDRRLPRTLYSRAARRERSRLKHIARYRAAVLLGGAKLPEQWANLRESCDEGRRSDVQVFLQGVQTSARRRRRARGGSTPCKPPDLQQIDRPALRAEFVLCARMLAEQLYKDLRRWRLRHPLGKRHLLPTTVAVTRACMAELQLELDEETKGRVVPSKTRLVRMDKSISRAARWAHLRSWQSNYNAACLYAIPLLKSAGATDAAGREFASRAIEHLALAASFTDSGFLATRRDWLISEDPDFNGLRKLEEFTRFAALYFPSIEVKAPRPDNAEEMVHAYYVRELLRDIASGWARGWESRAQMSGLGSDWTILPGWWRAEGEVWKLVRMIAGKEANAGADKAGSTKPWRLHVDAIAAQRKWRCEHGLEFAETRFRTFEEIVAPGEKRAAPRPVEELCHEATEQIHIARGMLAVLGGVDDPSPPAATVERHKSWLGQGDRPRSSHEVARMCQGRSLLWDAVARMLGDQSRPDELGRELARAIKRVRALEPWT